MSLEQEFELLKRVPFFADIEPAKLKLLAFLSERVAFDPGRPLMRQGDAADAAYVLIDGEAEVIAETPEGPVTLATLGENEVVGEIAILCDVPRTATVRAKSRVVALRISKESFMHMIREFPNMAVSIMCELARRLELTNQQLRAAVSELKRASKAAAPSS